MAPRDEGKVGARQALSVKKRAGRWLTAVSRARTLDGPAFQESVDIALAELELLPPGRARSRMAEDLIRLLLGRREQGDVAGLRCLDQLVRIGDENCPDRPGWQRTRAVARIMALMRAAAERELVDPRAAMDEVDRLAAEFADDPATQALASAAQAAFAVVSGSDVATLRASVAELGKRAGGNAEVAPMLEQVQGYLDALQDYHNGDTGTAFDLFSQLAQRSSEMPVAGVMPGAAAETAPVLDLMRSLMDEAPGADVAADDHRLKALRDLADRPGIAAGERALWLVARGGAALRQGQERDRTRIDAAIADLRTAVRLTSDDHPEHVFALASLAMAVHHRSEVSGSLSDVDEAITLLELARELAGGPGHRHWSFVNDLLGQLRRRRGDTSSRRIELEGLRGHTWQVLLQPDPISARAVARTAAMEAMAVAARFLGDQQPEDALRALDAGRGLMLFAATELRDPCTRLVDAGRPELARQWRIEQPPSARLRQDVLEVLSRDTGLLDAPDLGEIQAALRALDADALVYLVPATPSTPSGWAVIAPVEGPPRYLTLPNLVTGDGTDIERYLTAMATRDGKLVGDASDVRDLAPAECVDSFVDSVDRLCGWAWKAAMGPIIEPYLDAARVPHLVLIPMGDLARVPWQAARGPDGRYLVERVALSQAASARMLCDAAAAEPVRLTSAGLVVADPDTDGRAAGLPSARLEAYAIRESFYPSATYVGRLPKGAVSASGAGTPDDVRGWLRAEGADAGAMLHLASHGVMETALDSASSRLVLAGGDLIADELVDVLGGTRRRIGLVVLAACHTGRSIHGYDEAYSLATMFLAAGARSVLSTQWSVPDQETSLLMYMFHHYLMTERRPPWDALRRAQVWMLDSARTAPERMPGPLRRTIEGRDPTRVVAWAGFVHWGQ